MKTIAKNRKASYSYEILETYEAGLVLTGTEIKSLRRGRGSIAEAYARAKEGELFVVGMHIPPYEEGGRFNPDPGRDRKLLLHRKQIDRLVGAVSQKGLAIVPLSLYIKDGWAKLQLGLVRGKRKRDKRQAILERDQKWEMDRAAKEARRE